MSHITLTLPKLDVLRTLDTPESVFLETVFWDDQNEVQVQQKSYTVPGPGPLALQLQLFHKSYADEQRHQVKGSVYLYKEASLLPSWWQALLILVTLLAYNWLIL